MNPYERAPGLNPNYRPVLPVQSAAPPGPPHEAPLTVMDAAPVGNPLVMTVKALTHSRPAMAGTLDSPQHLQALEWMKARGQTPPGSMPLRNPYPLPR